MEVSTLTKIVNATASLFCGHEWTSRYEPHRMYLECMRCGRATPGIEIGRRSERPSQAPRSRTLDLVRRAA